MSGVKERDRYAWLGESISFGRYETELDWAKWSAFSHNRYLEEVEKCKKPGSVAQKKAYFEKHYAKKAAEKAAAMLEVENACASTVSESVSMHNHFQGGSYVDNDLANGEIQNDNEHDSIVQSSEVVNSTDVNEYNLDVEGGVVIAKVDGAEMVIEENVDVEDAIQVEVETSICDEMENSTQVEIDNFTQVEISPQVENYKGQNETFSSATQEEKMQNKEDGEEEILSSASKKILVIFSPSGLSTQGRASKIPPFPSKIPPYPAKQATHVPTLNKKNATPKSKDFEADIVDKRRLTTKSVHMSMNFTSYAGEISKRTPPVLEKIKNLRDDSIKHNVSIANSTSRLTTRASVNGVLEQFADNPSSKNRRAKTCLSKSVAKSITPHGIFKSTLKEQSSSTANGNKPRGPIMSCPFSLRSEERAAKRKEFFQRLEEKKNGEAETKQQQMRSNKEKAGQDVRKLRQTTGLKAKSNEDYHPVKKIPATWSQSQNLERQPTARKVLEPRTRMSVNFHSSNVATPKYKPRTSRSVTSFPKKNAHENSSPNIHS